MWGCLYQFWDLSPGLIKPITISRVSVSDAASLEASESGRVFLRLGAMPSRFSDRFPNPYMYS